LNRDKTLQAQFAEANPGAKYKSENWMDAGKVLTNHCPEWAKDVPYQVKKLAVSEFHTALATNKKLVAKKKRTSFGMRYKSRRSPTQCFDVVASAISSKGIYPTKLGKLHYTEGFPNEVLFFLATNFLLVARAV
jgi:putative transposase